MLCSEVGTGQSPVRAQMGMVPAPAACIHSEPRQPLQGVAAGMRCLQCCPFGERAQRAPHWRGCCQGLIFRRDLNENDAVMLQIFIGSL